MKQKMICIIVVMLYIFVVPIRAQDDFVPPEWTNSYIVHPKGEQYMYITVINPKTNAVVRIFLFSDGYFSQSPENDIVRVEGPANGVYRLTLLVDSVVKVENVATYQLDPEDILYAYIETLTFEVVEYQAPFPKIEIRNCNSNETIFGEFALSDDGTLNFITDEVVPFELNMVGGEVIVTSDCLQFRVVGYEWNGGLPVIIFYLSRDARIGVYTMTWEEYNEFRD